MNQADADRLAEALQARGYQPTLAPEEADLLVLNTCVVRQSAEDRVIGRLNSLRPIKRANPEKALIVMGCFVDDPALLAQRFDFVDAFFKPSDIAGVLEFVARRNGEVKSAPRAAPAHIIEYVPISYGCDHHCTYCIVALRRGAQRSRPVEEIAEEVRDLVARGAREVVLLGQNVDAYGTDLPGRPDLADILYAIHDTPGLWRIRFLTSHPADMTPRIIETAAALPKVCPSWELAVQSGDDVVLKRMGRGYTVAQFLRLVEHIRALMPECALNTDIIVGFPGETVEQFENTVRLLETVRFDVVHVAAYSPRPGTPAARLADDVPPEEKERRRALVEEIQTRIAGEINARLLGQEVIILVDGRQKGRWRGRTRTNKLVFFESAENWLGRLARVRVTWAGPWSLIGEVVGGVEQEP